jgi:acyl carrier protein
LLLQLEQNFDLRIKIDDINLEDLRTLARIARLVDANCDMVKPTASREPLTVAD